MALANAGEHLGNVGLIANRRANRNAVTAFFADSSEHTFCFGFSAVVVDIDESPVASQCAAGCRPDATAAARYQSSFLGKHPHSHRKADNSRKQRLSAGTVSWHMYVAHEQRRSIDSK